MKTVITFTTEELRQLFEAHVRFGRGMEREGITQDRHWHLNLTTRLKDGLNFSCNYEPGAGRGSARMGFMELDIRHMALVLGYFLTAFYNKVPEQEREQHELWPHIRTLEQVFHKIADGKRSTDQKKADRREWWGLPRRSNAS
jgi:hypothetical protein